MAIELTERQRLTVAAALTVLSIVVILAGVGALLFLVGAFFSKFSNVFLPVAVAGVVALIVQPYYDWLCSWRRISRPVALVLLFLSVLVPVVAVSWFLGAALVRQAAELISKAPVWWDSGSEYLREHWPQVIRFFQEHPLGQRIQQAVQGQQEALLEGLQAVGGGALSAGRGVIRGVGTLFAWAVLPVYFAFLLMMGRPNWRDRDFLPFLKPETRKDVIYLANEFVNIIVAFFRGQLLIALIQGVLMAIGFSVVGLKYGLLLGLVLGFLNIIPYLGSILGLAVTIPLAWFQPDGGLWMLAGVLIVFTVVQMIEGYVLTPRIMGERTGLHPMVIIIAIFFWGSALGGISGMILAIPLTAFLVVFWRLAREKYISEWV